MAISNKKRAANQVNGISREIRSPYGFEVQESLLTRTFLAPRSLGDNGARTDLRSPYGHRFDNIQHRAFEALMRHQRYGLDKRTHQLNENKGPVPETEPTENPRETQ